MNGNMHKEIENLKKNETFSIPNEKGLTITLSNAGVVKIKNGDTFNFGEEKISSISVPGHTKGSNCFLINKSLFTGDVIFPGRAGRTDSEEQFDLSVNSLKNTLYLLDEDIEFFPGHGKGGETLKDFQNQFKYFLSNSYKKGMHGVVWWVAGYKEEW